MYELHQSAGIEMRPARKAEHVSDPEYANVLVFVELWCLHNIG